MTKLISLTIVILALFSIANAHAKRQEDKSCQITFYGAAGSNSCEKYKDRNENEQINCKTAASGPGVTILNRDYPSFAQSPFDLDEIDFTGDCHRCRLVLWDQADYDGDKLRYTFRKCEDTGEDVIRTNEIWDKQSHSFKISCAF